MRNGSIFLTMAAVLGLVIAMVRMGKLDAKVRALESGSAASATAAAPAPEIAVYMARIQVYMHKLYWAGMAQNVPLADFYRHEINEVMEELARAGIVEDGLNISGNMAQIGLPAIEAMKAHLKEQGLVDFRARYEELATACNNCHAASGHAIIRVQVPLENRYTDQVFTP